MSSDVTSFSLFESFERVPTSHAEPVNRSAYQKMWNALSVPQDHPGRCILLRAPRAGHGKTHLLARLNHHLGAGFEFIPIYPSDGSQVDAASVLEDVLRRLTRALPGGGGLTALDLYARRLFASGLQPLVRSGEVPCQDREGALAALRNRPIETFDFHHPNAVTAHWTKENFEVLGPRLSLELAQSCGSPLRESSFWLEHLFRFASNPIEQPGRSGTLVQSAAGDRSLSHSSALERLASLLALLSLLVRVVLVADELEGFSADDNAALRFSAFLGAVRHNAERVDAIVSVNRDIWESAFLPRLSGGLSDRLSEIVVDLEPLGDDEIIALVESRVPGAGVTMKEWLRLGAQDRYARMILRRSSEILQSPPPPGTPVPSESATPQPVVTHADKEITAPPVAIISPPPAPAAVVEPTPVAIISPPPAPAAVVEPPHVAIISPPPAPATFVEPPPVAIISPPPAPAAVVEPPPVAPISPPPAPAAFVEPPPVAPISPPPAPAAFVEPQPVAAPIAPPTHVAQSISPEVHSFTPQNFVSQEVHSFAPQIFVPQEAHGVPATPVSSAPEPYFQSVAPTHFSESPPADTATFVPVLTPATPPQVSTSHTGFGEVPSISPIAAPWNVVPETAPVIESHPVFTPDPVIAASPSQDFGAAEYQQSYQPHGSQAPQTFIPEQSTFNAAAAVALWQASPFGRAEETAPEQPTPDVHPVQTHAVAPSLPPAEPIRAAQNDLWVGEPVPTIQILEPVAQAAPQSFHAAPPAQAAPVQDAPPVPQPAAVEVPSTDRVDDLLRQFRERYGRG